jgi:probable HAF family extracellular repeat protein
MRPGDRFVGVLLVLSGIGVASEPPAGAAPVYSVTDLGTNFTVTGMNNAGQLVGVRSVNGGPATPFLYSGGTFTDLPSGTRPVGITESGQPINGDPGWTYQYGPLDRNRTEFAPTTMANSQGYQVGSSSDYNWLNFYAIVQGAYVRAPSAADGTPGPQLYYGTPPQGPDTHLSGIPGNSSIVAINDAGQVAGNYASWWNEPQHAFLSRIQTNPQAGPPAPGVDLGTLGGQTSMAFGMNNRGEVVGQSQAADGSTHAFVYRDGEMIELGGGPDTWANALAVNNKGTIVGGLDTLKPATPGEVGRALDQRFGVLFQDGQMLKLNDLLPAGSGWFVESAVRINDAGQILAYASKDGQESQVLLTPLPPDATPVPEPGTLALFGLAAGVLVLRGRRQSGVRAAAQAPRARS